MNAEQRKFYLQHHGSKCPFCESDNIEGTGQRDFDSDWATSEVQCLDCEKRWKDVYILQDVID